MERDAHYHRELTMSLTVGTLSCCDFLPPTIPGAEVLTSVRSGQKTEWRIPRNKATLGVLRVHTQLESVGSRSASGPTRTRRVASVPVLLERGMGHRHRARAGQSAVDRAQISVGDPNAIALYRNIPAISRSRPTVKRFDLDTKYLAV
eukprot:4324276-Pleurochrysis_carterae.AAC.1